MFRLCWRRPLPIVMLALGLAVRAAIGGAGGPALAQRCLAERRRSAQACWPTRRRAVIAGIGINVQPEQFPRIWTRRQPRCCWKAWVSREDMLVALLDAVDRFALSCRGDSAQFKRASSYANGRRVRAGDPKASPAASTRPDFCECAKIMERRPPSLPAASRPI